MIERENITNANEKIDVNFLLLAAVALIAIGIAYYFASRNRESEKLVSDKPIVSGDDARDS